jgi:transposase
MDKKLWSEIRILNAGGLGIRAIARRLGISRNTVRAALVSNGSMQEQTRQRQAFNKVIAFKEPIYLMLSQRLIGTRILHELRKMGYNGGKTSLYLYLRKIKDEVGHDSSKVIERFETSAGEQAQFDWSKYVVEFSGSLVVVYVFCMVLSYSRRKFFWASLNDRQHSVLEAIEKALWHFGGSPKELLVDNARCFVANPNPQSFRWNETFYNFCGYYRIKPVACKVRRAQTKGKVEKQFFYLEHHFIRGNAFRSMEHLAVKLQEFCIELDNTKHPTTGFVPIERFEEEKQYLTVLPPSPFISPFSEPRKVSWDCLVPYGGCRYSVPYQFAGKQVFVKVSQGNFVEVYSSNGNLIATHTIAKKGECVIVKEHYDGLRKEKMKTLPMLRDMFVRQFPEHSKFFEGLMAQHRFNAHSHIRQILSLRSFYPKQVLEKAFLVAIKYNTYSHSFVRAVVEKYHKLDSVSETKLEASLLPPLPRVEVQRQLTYYQSILKDQKEVK